MTKTTIKQWPIPNSNPSQDMTQYPPPFSFRLHNSAHIVRTQLGGKTESRKSGKTRKAVTVKGSEAEQKKKRKKQYLIKQTFLYKGSLELMREVWIRSFQS